MKKNVGSVDKMIRIFVALVVGVLIYLDVVSGTLAIVLGVVAIVFLLTAFFGFCLIYKPLGINTCRRK